MLNPTRIAPVVLRERSHAHRGIVEPTKRQLTNKRASKNR
jgi:hypothetical protein